MEAEGSCEFRLGDVAGRLLAEGVVLLAEQWDAHEVCRGKTSRLSKRGWTLLAFWL